MYKSEVELSVYCEGGHGSDGFFIAIFKKEVEFENIPAVGDDLIVPYIVPQDGKDHKKRREAIQYRKPRVLKIEKIYSKSNGEPSLVFAYDGGKTAEEFDTLREEYVHLLGFKKDFTPPCYRVTDFRPGPEERERQARRLADLFEQMRKLAPADSFAGAATDSEIEEAERALEMKIPTDYKKFIKKFGASSWPESMCGAGSNVIWDRVLTDIVLSAKSFERNPIPDYLLPFSPSRSHDYFCFDLSRSGNGECPVVVWYADPNRESPIHFYVSFVDWLDHTMAERLEFSSLMHWAKRPQIDTGPNQSPLV